MKSFNDKALKKRALITAWSLNEMGGAGLNCFELAEELKRQGVMSDFFTYQKRIGPLSKQVEKLGYRIYTDRFYNLKSEDDQDYAPLNLEDYDYMFFVENIIPISILRKFSSGVKLPKIATLYMSELVGYPTDTPLTKLINEKIADLNLTISNKARRDVMYRVLDESVPVDLYRNPAPVEFSQIKKRKGDLKKIAVIHSSGTGNEVINIKDNLNAHGIEIEYIGPQFKNIKKVDADFYDKYDLIVGIGKNVQYSLVSGVPIYIYGRFGGPGYLNDKLYHKIINEGKADNFSGREYGGFRSADEISQEIIEGYTAALKFHEKKREEFIKEYSIDKVVERIINKLDLVKDRRANLEQKDVNWLVSIQILIDLFWHNREDNEIHARKARVKIDELERRVNNYITTSGDTPPISKSAALLFRSIKRSISCRIGFIKHKTRIRRVQKKVKGDE